MVHKPRLVAVAVLLAAASSACSSGDDASPRARRSPPRPLPSPKGTVDIIEADSEVHPAAFALDAVNRRMLVTVYCSADVCDSSRDALWVIDTTTNRVLRRIPIPGIEGVAVGPATGRVYLTVRAASLWVLDAKTYAVEAKIPVPAVSPIEADPRSDRVYVADYESDTQRLLVIDGAGKRITDRIPGAGGVVGRDDTRRTLYAFGEEPSFVAIDATTNRVTRTVPLDWEPTELDVDPGTGAVYVVGGWKETFDPATQTQDVLSVEELKVFDADGREKMTIDLDLHPVDIAVDPAAGRLYVLGSDIDGNATLTVLDSSTGTVLSRLPGVPSLALLFDRTSRLLYVLGFKGVGVINAG